MSVINKNLNMDDTNPAEKIFWSDQSGGFVWSGDMKGRSILWLEGTGWSLELDSAEAIPLEVNRVVNCPAGTRRRFISDGTSGLKFRASAF